LFLPVECFSVPFPRFRPGSTAVPLLLPEHRQIELYSKKKALAVAEDPALERALAEAAVARLVESFTVLDHALGGSPVAPGAALEAWAKYRAQPRRGGLEKLTAELYRTLRLFHAAATHETGRVESRNGLIKASATVDHTALSIRLTHAGADLLASAVAYRQAESDGPYPEAYVEAMLTRYWSDIAGEIRWYHDEDRVLFQYCDRLRINRHVRFDCDNPRVAMTDGRVRLEVGPPWNDPLRTPIDFFVTLDDHLHILPVEALDEYALPVEELPRWRARLDDGAPLPAVFRARFTREVMAAGLPMT